VARSTVYNNIVKPELWEQVNKENKELIKDWVEYLQSVDRSKKTIEQYVNDLKIFFCWFLEKANNKFFIEINKKDVMKFQNYCLTVLKISSSRIRRLRSTISSLSNYIESMLDIEYPDFRNIINRIPAPTKQEVREKTVLDDTEIQLLLDTLVNKKQYQQACVVALAMASGCRKSELLRFKVSYFDEKNIICGSLYRTPEKIKTKGRGSTGKLLYKYILVTQFKKYLDLWLKEREILNITSEWLFVSLQTSEELKVTTLDGWTKEFSKIVNKDFYFHCLRHYFTTNLSKANIPDKVIQEIGGWSSLEMVSLYTDITIDDELDKYFSKDGIKKIEKKSLNDL